MGKILVFHLVIMIIVLDTATFRMVESAWSGNMVMDKIPIEFPLEKFLQSAFDKPKIAFSPDFLSKAKLIHMCTDGVKNLKCCDCDEDCFRKRTCCIDKLWDPLKPVPLDEYMVKFKKQVDESTKLECKPLQPFASLPLFKKMLRDSSSLQLEYYLVNSCPSSSVKEPKCINDENLPEIERLPVLDEQLYIFKNKYCAMCNNVESFVNLNLTVGCNQLGSKVNRSRLAEIIRSKPTGNFLDTINEFGERWTNIKYSKYAPYRRIRYLKCNSKMRLERECKDPNSYCHLYQGSFRGYHNLHCHQCQEKVFYEQRAFDKCTKGTLSQYIDWSITISFTPSSTQVITQNYSKKKKFPQVIQ